MPKAVNHKTKSNKCTVEGCAVCMQNFLKDYVKICNKWNVALEPDVALFAFPLHRELEADIEVIDQNVSVSWS